MARAEIKMPEEFLNRLAKIGDRSEAIIPKVLEAGADVIYQKVRSTLSEAIGKNTKEKSRATGELLEALGTSPVKIDSKGVYNLKIGFAEPRSDGGSNAKIANILEYGKHGQAPKPFLKPAKTQSQKACIEAMKNKLESEMNDI